MATTINPLSASRNQSVICFANQLTGFYMRATLALNGLMKITVIITLLAYCFKVFEIIEFILLLETTLAFLEAADLREQIQNQ